MLISCLYVCRCQALNTMGDNSSEDKRRSLFREADTDHSGAIDFLEFVHVSKQTVNNNNNKPYLIVFTIIVVS